MTTTCQHCAEIERTKSWAVCPVHQPALYARLEVPERDEQERAA